MARKRCNETKSSLLVKLLLLLFFLVRVYPVTGWGFFKFLLSASDISTGSASCHFNFLSFWFFLNIPA